MSTSRPEYDVAILGAGIAGSSLGAVLAKQGAKVLLADAGSHPRFAVGESMIPQLTAWMEVLALRYDVPELFALADANVINEKVSNTFGRKRHFGFMLHHPGEEPDPSQAHQFVIPKLLSESSHLFRQDSDAYLFRLAVSNGCDTRQNWMVTKVAFDDDRVTLLGADGREVSARYLVDASGFRSPLAEHLELREKPARFKHHARSMFTHMVGVRPYDDVIDTPDALKPPARWHEGTMHHLFDRGWFWIIPFDNHDKSRNPLCSVGVTLDERKYPRPTDLTPDEEFAQLLKQFPAVERQFTNARRVREWVSTGRMQYSSRKTVGKRWCLMSHAAGFLDPLYSRGMSNTFELINVLAPRLLAALKDDDFSEERFAFVEEMEQGLLDWNDILVNCSYISFSHFRLWDAVFRVWGSGTTPGTLRVNNALRAYRKDGDPAVFEDLEKAPHTGLWWPDSDAFKELVEATERACLLYESGEIDGDTAADMILRMVESSEAVSTSFGWKDLDQRFVFPSQSDMLHYLEEISQSPLPELSTLGREAITAFRAQAAKGGWTGR